MNARKGWNHDRSMLVHAAGAGLGIALAGGLYLGVVRPVHSARANAIQQRTALASLTEELSEVERDMNSARSQGDALQKQLDSAVRLQDPSRLNRYVTDVMRVATDAKLTVLEAPQGEYRAAHPDFGRVPIALQGAGQPADVLAFLDSLHEHCRDIEVTGVEIDSAQGAQGERRYRVEMDWYTLPVHRSTPNAQDAPGGAEDDASNDRAGGKR
jgi:hypothetical protein